MRVPREKIISKSTKIFNGIGSRALDPFFDFIFPKLCLHCSDVLVSGSRFLCPACFSQMQLIDPLSSCPCCFSEDYKPGTSFCSRCYKTTSFLTAASAFDYQGPAESLVKKLKYHDQPYLAESLASFMVMQLFKLQWPIPDCVIPVPISRMRLISRGYNQSLLLAEEIGRQLNRPVFESLGRKSGDYSQASLGYQQRMQLSGSSLYLKGNEDLQDKNILLVDDVMTTGSTLRKCAEALIEGCPEQIYGLTICRSNTG